MPGFGPRFGRRRGGRRFPPGVLAPTQIPAKVLLTSMASLASVTGSTTGLSMVADSDNPMGQASVLQFQPPAANTHYFLVFDFGRPVDLRNGTIEWFVKHQAYSNSFSAHDIEFHSTTPAGPVGANYSGLLNWNNGIALHKTNTTSNGTAAGRWQTLGFKAQGTAIQHVGTGADMSAVRWIRLRIRSETGKPLLSLRMGPMRFQPNPLDKAKLMFAFDDAHDWVYHVAFPIMRSRNQVGMIFPGAAQVDVGGFGKMTIAQLQELQAAGWQIASQAWSSESVQSQEEIDALRAWMLANGFAGGAFGSYYSAIGERVLEYYPLFRSNYRAVRLFGAARQSAPPVVFPESYPWPDPTLVHAIGNEGGYPGFLTDYLQQIVAEKAVGIVAWHNSQAEFQEVSDFAWENPALLDVTTEERLFAQYVPAGA